MQALFLRHEGYLGAIGAFLKGAEECGEEPGERGEVGESSNSNQPTCSCSAH